MKKTSEPVVFFGSGPVAAKSLELLLESFEVDLVITKPRAPHHKGSVPILELAEKLSLRTRTVSTKKELDTLMDSRPSKARIGVLIDFGIIVSQQVIDYFELGIVNSHFSLLPKWRGADPITFSILSGQAKTGVSLMLLTAGMDEGPILAASEHELTNQTTASGLTDTLIEISDNLLQTVLPAYIDGSLVAITQAESAEMLGISAVPTYSRKLTKQDGLLDLAKPADVLEHEIRAYLEWPKSKMSLGGIDVIITAARAANVPIQKQPGDFEILDEPKTLIVYCGEGYLTIERLKPIGKNEMSTAEFIRGYASRLGQ